MNRFLLVLFSLGRFNCHLDVVLPFHLHPPSPFYETTAAKGLLIPDVCSLAVWAANLTSADWYAKLP